MQASKAAIEMIKKYEGLVLTPYKDAGVGIITIGYGHTGWKGGAITPQKAEELLMEDIVKAQAQVEKYSKYGFNQNQYDALVSFAFNVGSIDQLTSNGRRSIAEISAHIEAYNKAGGKVLPGLTKRRHEEWLLFNKAASPAAAPSSDESKLIKTIIDDVIAGKYGNGEKRKENLYKYIQGLVNKRLGR